jgi:hypothetical protein
MSELTLIARILTDGKLTMTVTPTHPDLDVDAFQVDLTSWPDENCYTGRSVHLDRAIALALQQWRTKQPGVRDDRSGRRAEEPGHGREEGR